MSAQPSAAWDDPPDLTITLDVELDDTDPYGNACASGDDVLDRSVAAEVSARLARGEVWAWCCVRVAATSEGVVAFSSWLGGCSYENEADFRQNGYFEDLRSEAVDELRAQLSGRIHTTAREWFSLTESRELAALVFKRFGRDQESAAAAWRRLLESRSITTDEFMRLAAPERWGR